MNASEQKNVERIRAAYTDHEVTKLDELKQLNKKVKRPTQILAYAFGTVGALVLGTGMCLAMEVIGDLMIAGIGIGLVGIAMVSLTYPIYQKMLNKRRQKYAEQIITLSDELLGTASKEEKEYA